MAGASAALGESAHPGLDPALDRHAHADENTRFETGSPTPRRRGRPGDTEGRALEGSATPPTGLGRADAESSRVEPSLHVVARGENFWTISRLYYGSARYYRALWKANAQKHPNINDVYINDVILIPAPENLDAAFVVPSRPRAVAGRDEGSTRDQIAEVGGPAPAGTERLESFPTTQIARTSDESGSNPGRRPGRADAELELPVGGADRGPARGSRVPKVDGVVHEDDDGPATRLTARPRNPAPIDRPVYKVRRYDTLRSIARDALGDSHRADEIYEINRDIIADPTRLIPGQLLELPEDADSRRVPIRERYRGS
jgi:nucleoid-associated protein YgaU